MTRATNFPWTKDGAGWRAGASIWDGKSTISRCGRDAYMQKCDSAESAKRLAETVYLEA